MSAETETIAIMKRQLEEARQLDERRRSTIERYCIEIGRRDWEIADLKKRLAASEHENHEMAESLYDVRQALASAEESCIELQKMDERGREDLEVA